MNARTGFTDRTAIRYRLALTISVEDAELLWTMAAERCAHTDDGLSPDEIVEVIGPRESPSVEDCLTALVLSSSLVEGCSLLEIGAHRMNETLAARFAPQSAQPRTA